MGNLAEVFVAIRPDTTKFAGELLTSIGGVNAEPAGRTITGRIVSGAKKAAAVSGVAIGGVLSVAVAKGFNRLTAIENAEAKLTGLGHSAGAVEGIMGNALASVKGTAFGLDKAAATAAGAVASGIKPGQDLQRVLGLVGDAATIAGTDYNAMGSIFNKVSAANRLTMGEVNQLDQGIPIMQMLADQYGVTAGEARKMVEDGKVDFAAFSTALEDNIGGAALKSGDTTQGAFANMNAALGRLGASLLGGVFPHFKSVFTGITGLLDGLEAKVGPWADVFGREFAGGISAFGAAWAANDGTVTSSGFPGFMERVANVSRTVFTEIVGGIRAFGAAWAANDGTVTSSGFPGFMERVANFARDAQAALGRLDFSSISGFLTSVRAEGGAVAGNFGSIGQSLVTLAPAIGEFVSGAGELGRQVLPIVTSALAFLADHVDVILANMPLIVGAFIAWKVATQAVTVAMAANTPILLANNVARIVANTQEARMTATRLAGVGAIAASTAAESTNTAAKSRGTIATMAATVAERTKAAAARAGAAAQWLLNAAMTANPIGIIIAALVALGAAVVIAYQRSDTFRAVVQGAWAGIQAAVSTAWTGYIQPALRALSTFVTGTLIPLVQRLWTGVIRPAFEGIGSVIRTVWTNVIQPVLQLWWAYITNVLVPIVRFLWSSVVSPVFSYIGSKVRDTWNGVIKPALSSLWSFIRDTLVPILRALWSDVIQPTFSKIGSAISTTWSGTIKPALESFKTNIDNVRTGFETAKTKFDDFMTKLRRFSLPGWIKDLADLVGDIKDGVSGVASNVWSSFTSAFGDAPGSMKGVRIGPGGSAGAGVSTGGAQGYVGTALRRVQGALPSGLRITSTYRSPEQNRRVGGSPTSHHMDRNNPAVDIGGPTSMLDRFAAQLREMGGWRQLLWRVAGHFDHIHVAHSGGRVSSGWARMPGDRSDERTARLQVGEEVLSRRDAAAYRAGAAGPSTLVLIDVDGKLIGRMKVTAREALADALGAVGRYQ